MNPLNMDLSKTIFWTGSGISGEYPSCLPLGNSLADFYLESAVGETAAKALKKFWSNGVKSISYFPNASNYGMRLEFIIDAINKLDLEFMNASFSVSTVMQKYRRFPLINGFSRFAATEPNYNHVRLADFAKKGSIVITANYDLCVEYAMGEPTLEIGTHCGVDTIHVLPDYYFYHFHGIAVEKDAVHKMGATISRVKRSLPEPFTEQLIQYFKKGYNIVFLGYSGSDFFDVTPFFRSLPEDVFTGNAIFFSYNEASNSPKILELLRPFQNKFQYYGMTNEFLDKVSSDEKDDCDKIFFEKGKKAKEEKPERWKLEFQKILEEYRKNNALQTYQFMNAFRIASQTGIHIGRLYADWDKRIAKMILDWKNDSPETLKNLIHGTNDLTQTIFGDILSLPEKDASDTFLKAKQLIREITVQPHDRKYERPTKETHISFKDLSERVNRTYDIISSEDRSEKAQDFESYTIQYLCTRSEILLKKWFLGQERKKTLKEISILQKHFEKLSSLPYNKFLYISYFLSLCRKKNLLDTILCPNFIGNDKSLEFEISLEITSMTQLYKTYYNLANIYLIKFRKSLNILKLFKQRKMREKGKKIYHFSQLP